MSRKKKNSKKYPKPPREHSKQHSKEHQRVPGRAGPSAQPKKLKATVDKNRKGFAFLVFERGNREDAFVPPHAAEGLFPGDRVEVSLDSRGEARQIRVLEHRFREVVGRFQAADRGGRRARGPSGWIILERKRIREEIFVPQITQKVAMGDWVRARLVFGDEAKPSGRGRDPDRSRDRAGSSVTAEILEVFGKDLPARADLQMVSTERNLVEGHSRDAELEAEQIPKEISDYDRKGRRDLTEVPFITIDGETARDFDDAVYVERTPKGYFLWVAIADVSFYVKEGSQLDQNAFSKGTSVYFPERAFHMLPRALSENLCSLRPMVDRLVMVAKIEFDRNGRKLKTEVMEGVIRSQRRATYEQIQAEYEQNKKDPSWKYSPHFQLYELLKKSRSERGSIDFELPEAEVLVDPEGEVLSIRNRSRLDSHRLIEEFMISANESVTEWMMMRKWPFIYRVHDEPTDLALEKFVVLAENLGVNFDAHQNDEATSQSKQEKSSRGRSEKNTSPKKIKIGKSPKAMATLIRDLEGHPAQALLNLAFLRSMKQAIYTATHGIHYGLASTGYTHFTSPIRRYPDLIVHRLIRAALHSGPPRAEEKDGLEEKLAEICEHCSYRERLAADAERESIKLKQVRLMVRHLGEEYDAKIVGILASGFFAQIENPFVEGLVSVESLKDDWYEFDEGRMILRGQRRKKTFKIGELVRVQVVRADLDRRQIDFEWVPKPGPAKDSHAMD